MTKQKFNIIAATTLILGTAGAVFAAGNAEIIDQGSKTCISSNGLPNHSTGNFPNSGNPHSISAQSISVCVSSNPKKKSTSSYIDRGAIGIALNGVMIRPEAADYYDPNSPRGFSRTKTNWRLEPMGPDNTFGLDANNAHVDRRGLYHYHGMPSVLAGASGSSQIGYAADGFEIHYVGSKVKSGYTLKSGTRPSGGTNPGGKYDGSFVEDYKFVGGSGKLDKCNGGTLNGKYVYFATDTFPYYPRCLWGTVANGFR